MKGAAENNLKNIEVAFPLGCFTCVTGVSGSGKSTLVDDILRRALFRRFYNSKEKPGAFRALRGVEQIDKAIVIDQSAIGRTPRSNPVTYTGAFGPIRELFAQLPAARVRGYGAGRFSFNVKGGRCENCEGGGLIKIEMHFLPDVYVQCEVCHGRRYNRETLEITYKGKNIADVLDLTVDEAARFFRNVPSISDKLNALLDVGLGYLQLGQAGTTLSGGEAQRVKLATELAKKATGRTVYILDEPTTGLHFADIEKLLQVLMKLRDAGNTLIVIEHNLEMIKCADWIVDLGPEGGELGGELVAAGPPEEIVDVAASHTGKYLRPSACRRNETRSQPRRRRSDCAVFIRACGHFKSAHGGGGPLSDGVPEVAVTRLEALLKQNLSEADWRAVAERLLEAMVAANQTADALKLLEDPRLQQRSHLQVFGTRSCWPGCIANLKRWRCIRQIASGSNSSLSRGRRLWRRGNVAGARPAR